MSHCMSAVKWSSAPARATIVRFGVVSINGAIDGLSLALAYTTGLFGMGHPELLVFGTPPDLAFGLLNNLGERIRAGANLVPGIEIDFEQWHHKVIPEEVPNPGDIVFEANRFYQRPAEASVPVLQLSYDDGTGVYPWDPDYPVPEMQPRPGTFTA